MTYDRCVECGKEVDPEVDPELYDDGDCCCSDCREYLSDRAELDKFLDDPRRR